MFKLYVNTVKCILGPGRVAEVGVEVGHELGHELRELAVLDALPGLNRWIG